MIEDYYSADVTSEFVEEFLNSIAAHLGLRAYGSPAVSFKEWVSDGMRCP